MILSPHQYYHLYNRSNNSEVIFKHRDAYLLFLEKYREYLEGLLATVAYCLMPTHFHFLVYVDTHDVDKVKKHIGILLSSFTMKTNLMQGRHGSLFQRHTKAKLVDEDDYLITLMTYIHQNPIRARLVSRVQEWEFSSYRDLVGPPHLQSQVLLTGPRLKKELVREYFSSIKDFEEYSRLTLDSIRKEYWI